MSPRLKRQKVMAEINITPFTDVILVLLVIFMITTPLILQSSIKVNLPRAGSAKTLDGADQVSITVTHKGIIYLNQAVVTMKNLKEKVAAVHKNNPNLKVILFSDKTTQFKDIVAVLDAMNEIGISSLNIAAKTKAD